MGFRFAALPRTVTRGLALWGAVAVAVIGLFAVGTFAYVHRDSTPAASTKATVATVRRGQVTVTEAAAGTVQAAETRGLSFATSGTVTTIAVKAGDTVTAGQVLARIDDADARNAVTDAESSVATAEQALSTAQSSAPATTGTTGCQAAAAYRSASPSPSPSLSPSPSAAPSRPAARSATPTRTGSGSGAGSGSGSGSGCTNTGTGSRAGGSDSLYSAQQQLNNAKLALTQAQSNLAGTVISAPIDGKVLTISGAVGTTESPGGTAFLTVGSTQDTQVKAQFSEADVASLAVGQSGTIALASRTGTFNGKVSRIDPAGTASGQLVRYTVMIAFDNSPADLLYGQSANVVVTTGSAANVLYVSSSAVSTGPAGSGTVTVRSGGRDQRRTVQIGLRGDQYTEIRSGLTEGEVVVVAGGS
ncbi:MAG: hypothetical protein V7603_2654 [Micromonosporaceae bacterium]